MDLQQIENLIKAYDAGETSLEQEACLRTYFKQDNVPQHLMPYKSLFRFYENAKQDQFTKRVTPQQKGFFRPWMAAAASILVVAAAVWYTNSITLMHTDSLGTYEDPQLALQKTKDVLNLVSTYMNEGTTEIEYLTEFDTAKDKLLKTTDK